MEGVQIGVSTELLMRHVWGEGVTSPSKHSLARRAIALKEFARLPLSPTLPLNDVKQKREGEVRVKCQFACSIMSLLLLDTREERTGKRATGDAGRILNSPHPPVYSHASFMNACNLSNYGAEVHNFGKKCYIPY